MKELNPAITMGNCAQGGIGTGLGRFLKLFYGIQFAHELRNPGGRQLDHLRQMLDILEQEKGQGVTVLSLSGHGNKHGYCGAVSKGYVHPDLRESLGELSEVLTPAEKRRMVVAMVDCHNFDLTLHPEDQDPAMFLPILGPYKNRLWEYRWNAELGGWGEGVCRKAEVGALMHRLRREHGMNRESSVYWAERLIADELRIPRVRERSVTASAA